MKKLAYLIILAGLAFFIYPTAKHLYEDYKQQELLRSFTEMDMPTVESPGDGNSLQIENSLLTESLAIGEAGGTALPSGQQADSALNIQSEVSGGNPSAGEQARPSTLVKKTAAAGTAAVTAEKADSGSKAGSGAWALLQMDKIGSKMPVLEGASMQNMKYAAAHMSGTELPGETGNSVIAAHRSYSYGRLFNRLNELMPGDEIKITRNKQLYTYGVTAKKTVEPNDLSVLNKDGERKLLTLVTCDETGKHRVIIQAELK